MPVIGVYLASDFARHAYVEEVARALALGRRDIVVVSRWHGTPGEEDVAGEGTTKAHIPPGARDIALRAIEDIRRCDMFVLFTSGEFARGGRHFETGLAYGLRKPIIVVGPVEHAFHSLPNVLTVAPGASPRQTAVLLASRIVDHRANNTDVL